MKIDELNPEITETYHTQDGTWVGSKLDSGEIRGSVTDRVIKAGEDAPIGPEPKSNKYYLGSTLFNYANTGTH